MFQSFQDIKDFDDANLAGTVESSVCTLILTEGIASKSLASTGLSVTGTERSRFGLYTLKNPLINVRRTTGNNVKQNKEVAEITRILGLDFSKTYESEEEFKSLRYGKVLILADRDEDGSHMKGLVINLFHFFWPHLIQKQFLQQFIIPYVKVYSKGFEKYFYSIENFQKWYEVSSYPGYKIKYFKSLTTCTPEEMKSFFSEFKKYCVDFQYSGEEDDKSIELVFKKDMEDDRKTWMQNSLHESAIYSDEINSITYKDFIDKEFLFFSDLKNTRSIPHVIDGLTRSERKIVYTCLVKDFIDEISVLKVIGSTIEFTSYNQSADSLGQTIIKLAQNFVGSNNINILEPIGQFGSRVYGGKDSAKPKYLFTKLNSVCRQLFSLHDISGHTNSTFNDLTAEPKYLLPIIPLILINGSDGIGSGWKTKIMNYNPIHVIKNIYRMIDNLEPIKMIPQFKNFKGTVNELGANKLCISGTLKRSESNSSIIKISELPISKWTQSYKDDVLQPLLIGSTVTPKSIEGYQEYHTDNRVRYDITLADNLKDKTIEELYEIFKLHKKITSHIVAFNHDGVIKDYISPENVLKEFFEVRLDEYKSRREYMIRKLQEKFDQLSTIHCHVQSNNNAVTIENTNTNERIHITRENKNARDFCSTAFPKSVNNTTSQYNFLFDMWKFTDGILKSLNEELKSTKQELQVLKNTSAKDIWKSELEQLEAILSEDFNTDSDATLSEPSLAMINGPTTSTPKSKSVPRITSDLSESFADMHIK